MLQEISLRSRYPVFRGPGWFPTPATQLPRRFRPYPWISWSPTPAASRRPDSEVKDMRLTNRKLKRREEGNALLEFAAVSIVVIPLFFGMVGAGIQLGRMNEAVQICRDAGHMYARGVDFSQTANQNILASLALGTGMTATGGNAVVIMSQISQIYSADCTAAGLTSGECTNLGQLVFINQLVTGNASLRASNYGTPPSGMVNSLGNISAANYLTVASLVAT